MPQTQSQDNLIKTMLLIKLDFLKQFWIIFNQFKITLKPTQTYNWSNAILNYLKNPNFNKRTTQKVAILSSIHYLA